MPVPRGAAPPALLGVIALIVAIAVAVVPVVDARPRDKKGGGQETVTTESQPPDDTSVTDLAPVEVVPAENDQQQYEETVEPSLAADPGAEQTTAGELGTDSNERTLLSSDADGDYLPDALDNCPNVQNPDQADADGDGNGDDCPVYEDTDGDGMADKEDNCPGLATYDYADSDGDGIGDACDKSPDGIEPEPEPIPDLDGQGGEGAAEPTPVDGAGQDGESVERDGRSRSKQRSRTENSKPIITTGEDGAEEDAQSDGAGSDGEVITEGPDAVPYEEPARDNPRRNEELIAEAAASGELYAPPEPPPAAQRAWDEEAVSDAWEPIVRIDAGATEDVAPASAADLEPDDRNARQSSDRTRDAAASDPADEEVGDSEYARGWTRALLLLQDEPDAEEEPDDGDGDRDQGSAPVPVENGLVITGNDKKNDAPKDEERQNDEDPDEKQDDESSVPAAQADERDPGDGEEASSGTDDESAPRAGGSSRKDGSRRDGSSRAAAASPGRSNSGTKANESKNENQDQKSNSSKDKDKKESTSSGKDKDKKQDREKANRERAAERRGGELGDWSKDRYFDGGSALDWSGDVGVAGTDEEDVYLTQRSGTGTGKRRGFAYAIPVEEEGAYLVRLYFAEPYWGAPDGPEGEAGRRVFSVSAEGDALIEDLDVFDEAGALTALVKQAEVKVDDGELNLEFIASEGEPAVAAIEVLQPKG